MNNSWRRRGGGGTVPPGGSDGNGGGTFNTPVGPNTPTGQTGVLNTITDWNCLTQIWDTVKVAGFNNFIQTILYDFNLSESITYKFKKEANSGSPRSIGRYSESEKTIYFNTVELQYATQEGLLVAIVHEILHAVLQNCTEMDDHNFVADHLITPIKNFLQYWYPQLPDETAIALAWTGLDETEAYKSVHNKSQVEMSQNVYFDFGNQYNPRNGTSFGNACF